MKSIFEQNGITYTPDENGILYPDLEIPQRHKPHYGKYGHLRKEYLKKYEPAIYSELLLGGLLICYLNHIDASANRMFEQLVSRMAQEQHIHENLKDRNQIAWVQAMNNIRNAAEEIVLKELIQE